MTPVELGPNRPHHFYRGGAAIDAFRGNQTAEDHRPEDWVASTTAMFGRAPTGLTKLPDGRLLQDAVAEEAEAWLGPDHVARFGADTALLVKLLDAGERLPVHCHPDQAFARRHLGSAHGKTEAWIVLDGDGEHAVYLGFREELDPETLATWVAAQDRAALLDALNLIPVQPGDAVFVPAGVPHAIGAGVFIAELQEPSDLSVMLERDGFELGANAVPDLGLGDERALECVDRTAWSTERLARVHVRHREVEAAGLSLLPHEADSFFRAERWRLDGTAELDAGFAVLVVVAGRGSLRTAGATETPVRRGATILVPWAAGPTTLSGEFDLIRCRPPAPATTHEAGA